MLPESPSGKQDSMFGIVALSFHWSHCHIKFDIIIFHTHKTKKGIIYDDFIKAEKNNIITNYTLPKNFEQKIDLIKNKNIDILFYPEIGMSFELYFLSYVKLAKKQMTSWGHPETTGNETIDYFLTSKLLEAPDGEKNYSEKLLYTNDLPMYYYTPIVNNALSENEISKNCNLKTLKILDYASFAFNSNGN